jgi:hypothetical protein
VLVKVAAFWDMVLCKLVYKYNLLFLDFSPEAVFFSETLVRLSRAERRCVPEVGNLQLMSGLKYLKRCVNVFRHRDLKLAL